MNMPYSRRQGLFSHCSQLRSWRKMQELKCRSRQMYSVESRSLSMSMPLNKSIPPLSKLNLQVHTFSANRAMPSGEEELLTSQTRRTTIGKSLGIQIPCLTSEGQC